METLKTEEIRVESPFIPAPERLNYPCPFGDGQVTYPTEIQVQAQGQGVQIRFTYTGWRCQTCGITYIHEPVYTTIHKEMDNRGFTLGEVLTLRPIPREAKAA